MREPSVAIAGCGVISAVGRGVDTLRQALKKNSSGLRSCERFNNPRFQSSIVGAALENDADRDNPAHVLATEALREAISSAALEAPAPAPSLPAGFRRKEETTGVLKSPRPSQSSLLQISPKRLGLVLSTTKANIEALERLSDGRGCSAMHLQADLLAADLAAENGARGPVQAVSVACVSGLIALMQGAKLIQRGLADAVLVVGVDHLSAFVVAGFTALKAIDPEGCRPFDRDRCGLTPGEAGAAIVLVRADLLDKPAVKIAGWGSSNDANHMTGPSRDGSGLAQAIRAALDSAKLSASEIEYVNVHGTGTPYNDAMESAALRTVFGESCPPVSGLKGMLGHTLGAAGVVETIACVLAMQEKILPGTPRLSHSAELMPVSLLKEPRPAKELNRVLKLNTGFGGVNGALILQHG